MMSEHKNNPKKDCQQLFIRAKMDGWEAISLAIIFITQKHRLNLLIAAQIFIQFRMKKKASESDFYCRNCQASLILIIWSYTFNTKFTVTCG